MKSTLIEKPSEDDLIKKVIDGFNLPYSHDELFYNSGNICDHKGNILIGFWVNHKGNIMVDLIRNSNYLGTDNVETFDLGDYEESSNNYRTLNNIIGLYNLIKK